MFGRAVWDEKPALIGALGTQDADCVLWGQLSPKMPKPRESERIYNPPEVARRWAVIRFARPGGRANAKSVKA